MAKNFKELQAKMPAEARARSEAKAKQMMEEHMEYHCPICNGIFRLEEQDLLCPNCKKETLHVADATCQTVAGFK